MPVFSKIVAAVAMAAPRSALAQQVGTQQAETHPKLSIQDCSASGCVTEQGEVTIDANWRWVNKNGQNCYMNDNTWSPTTCSDGAECARTCGVDGASYGPSYGVHSAAAGEGLDLNFVTKGAYSNNYGSRLYYMDSEDTYKMFHLKNREFTITVDSSNLPCGLNGAVYFVEMDKRGDYDGVQNTAGAKYGTGYCDAQCPHDIKWIKGEANVKNWNSTHDPPIGHYGTCCAEMDIWEANSRSTAYTPHTCSHAGSTKCEGTVCGDTDKGERYSGECDKDGCDFNSYRMGDESFYGKGPGFKVDTEKPVTVVTQFLTSNGEDDGDLSEVRRFYVQDGVVVPNSEATILGPEATNSVTDNFCTAQKQKFGDLDDFASKGGLKGMGEALDRGMVLVMSLWDDSQVNMLWLDSKYPLTKPPGTPGVARGPCPGGEENTPKFLRANVPNSAVTFSDIKYGTIGSTFDSSAAAAADPKRRLSETTLV